MAHTHITNIASLEALNSALSQYRTASGEPFRRFAPIFSEKLEALAKLETHFIKEVENARYSLRDCEIARSYDPPQNRRSCWAYSAALERAESNLATYRSLISKLRGVSGEYQTAANRYADNLQNILSSIVPNFSSLIGEMKAYSLDDSNIAGGGIGNTVESSSSLSALRTAAINAGVVGIAHDGTSGSTIVIDDTYNGNGTISNDNKGMDAQLGSDAYENDAMANVDVNSQSDSPVATIGMATVGGIATGATVAGLFSKKNKVSGNVKAKLNFEQQIKLEESKIIYKETIKKLQDYPITKTQIEKEIEDLTIKNENGEKYIFNLQQEYAKLEYQETIVWHTASDFKYAGYKKYAEKLAKEKEDNLKLQYGLTESEIEQVKTEAQNRLKKGAIISRLNPKLDKSDKELKGNIEDKGLRQAVGNSEKYLQAAAAIEAGFVEMSFSNPANELNETIKAQQKIIQQQQMSITNKQRQLESIQQENNKLQKILNKYGHDVINTQDDMKLIRFGNECKEVFSKY
jgi:hypothetical protein